MTNQTLSSLHPHPGPKPATNSISPPSPHTRNLGIFFVSQLKFHITRTTFFHLKTISCIHPWLTFSAAEALIHHIQTRLCTIATLASSMETISPPPNNQAPSILQTCSTTTPPTKDKFSHYLHRPGTKPGGAQNRVLLLPPSRRNTNLSVSAHIFKLLRLCSKLTFLVFNV